MPGPGDEKEPPSKSPFDDQPTTPTGGVKPPSGGPARTDTPLPALEQRYEILGEAGRGGMGIVYKARDRETGEVVALKVLKREIAAETTLVERFKNELRLARKITHKNVCRIHEFNRASDGTAYISMEYVEGDSLRRLLRRIENFGVRGGTRIAEQICAGMSEAHAQGVVHRDLKPENVMLDAAGNVKIMDFGIARSLEAGLTSTTGILGTPAYMAPEQASGKPLDNRADIYALGLILYEIFTGKRAFTGDTPVEVAMKQVHETPPAPRELEPALPPHIERAILKCLEKNPAKRFQSVDELEVALTQEVEVKLVEAQVPTHELKVPAHLAFWQRSDWILLAGATVGLAAFLGMFFRFHPASAMKIAVNAEEQKQIARNLFKKINWDAELGEVMLHFSPDGYYELASYAGTPITRRQITKWQDGISYWDAEMNVALAGGERRKGNYLETTAGRVFGFWIQRPVATANSPPTPQPDAAAMAQMKELSQATLTAMLGLDVSSATFSQRTLWAPYARRWPAFFEWRLPSEPKGVYLRCLSTVDGPQVLDSMCALFPYDAPGWSFDRDAFLPPLRYPLGVAALVLFAFVLFLARGVYRQPRSSANQYLAAFIAVVIAVGATGIRPPFSGQGGAFLNIVIPVLIFCLWLLLTYALLQTVSYYLSNRFPSQAASYQMLLSKRLFTGPAGLSLLRGIFAGAIFSGLWMAAVSLAGVWGKGLAGMLFWLEGYDTFMQMSPSFLDRVFPAFSIVEPLFVGWLLVALPLSLLRKSSARSRVLLAGLAAVWLACGYSLVGAMVFPRIAYHVLVVAQAMFFGAIFLRYDLLATLSALFTAETFLLAFPLLEIFQHLGLLPYAIPIFLWFALVAVSAAICFRPQAVGAYRRIAAVFE